MLRCTPFSLEAIFWPGLFWASFPFNRLEYALTRFFPTVFHDFSFTTVRWVKVIGSQMVEGGLSRTILSRRVGMAVFFVHWANR